MQASGEGSRHQGGTDEAAQAYRHRPRKEGGFCFSDSKPSPRRQENAPKSKKRITHIQLVCELCWQRTEIVPLALAEGVAEQFDKHEGCKPESEWPRHRTAAVMEGEVITY